MHQWRSCYTDISAKTTAAPSMVSQSAEEGVDVERSIHQSSDNHGILDNEEGGAEGRSIETVSPEESSALM